MAACITPKSKAREINSINVGFGEVPVVTIDGKTGWGLPGKAITFCREEALTVAQRLDCMIRSNMEGNSQKIL